MKKFCLRSFHNQNSLRKLNISLSLLEQFASRVVAYLTIKVTTDQGCSHSSWLINDTHIHTNTHPGTEQQASRRVYCGKGSGLWNGCGEWKGKRPCRVRNVAAGEAGKRGGSYLNSVGMHFLSKEGRIHQLWEMNKGQSGENYFTHTHAHTLTVWPPTHSAHCYICFSFQSVVTMCRTEVYIKPSTRNVPTDTVLDQCWCKSAFFMN